MADLITPARAAHVPALSGIAAAYLALLITAASTAIERYCKRIFESAAYVDEEYHGNGTTAMFLDNFPVTTLTSIVVVEFDGTLSTMLGTNYDVREATGEIQVAGDCTGDYCYFPKGFNNLRANYTAGYATVPEDVQEACAQLIAWMYGMASLLPGVKSEKLGDYAMSFGGVSTGEWPVMVKEILAQYRNIRP